MQVSPFLKRVMSGVRGLLNGERSLFVCVCVWNSLLMWREQSAFPFSCKEGIKFPPAFSLCLILLIKFFFLKKNFNPLLFPPPNPPNIN